VTNGRRPLDRENGVEDPRRRRTRARRAARDADGEPGAFRVLTQAGGQSLDGGFHPVTPTGEFGHQHQQPSAADRAGHQPPEGHRPRPEQLVHPAEGAVVGAQAAG
jgi:hypothetical protein